MHGRSGHWFGRLMVWFLAVQVAAIWIGTGSVYGQAGSSGETTPPRMARIQAVGAAAAEAAGEDAPALVCPQVFSFSESFLSFVPSSDTLEYAPQSFTMTQVYPGSLNFSPIGIEGVPEWLAVSPQGLAGPGTLTLTVDPTGLAGGVQTAFVILRVRWETTDDLRCDDGSYFGGYNVGLEIVVVAGDCTPQITQVRQVGGPAQQRKRYAVAVSVTLPVTCPADQKITVAGGETEAKLNEAVGDLRGDTLKPSMLTPDGASESTQTLAPGEVKEFSFESFHDWDWTDMRGQTCAHIFVPDVLLVRLAFISQLKDLIDLIDEMAGESDLVRWRAYGMQFTARNVKQQSSEVSFGPTDGRAARVEVRPEELLAHATMLGSIKTGVIFTGAGVGAVIASGGTASPAAIGGFAIETTMIIAACALFDMAVGEASAAGVMPAAVPDLPSLEGAPDSEGKTLALEILAAQEHQTSLYETLGLHADAPRSEREALLDQAQTQKDTYQSALTALETPVESAIGELEATGVEMNAATVAAVKNSLATEGLPQIERDILAEYGLSANDIDRLGQLAAQQMDSFPASWQESARQYVEWSSALMTITEEHIDDLRETSIFLPVVRE